MSTPPDQGVRDTITGDGLQRTLFVEAGAGTGKTRQLVERIVNLVLVEGASLEQIAAITFTEAAASELQGRIRVAFERAAAEASDPQRVERCRRALADADTAAISTLHGFASRLLAEFAVDAGLPPRVHVLDEVSSQLAHEARWERFVDALYDDPANEQLLTLARLVDVPLEARYKSQSTLKDVAAEFNQNWDRIDVVADEDPPPIADADFARFDAAVDAIEALPAQCSDPDDKFRCHLVDNLLPEMVAVRDLADPARKLRTLAGVAKKPWTKGRGGRKDAWGGDVVAARALVDDVNQAAEQVLGQVADVVLRHLMKAVAGEVRASAAARRADGGLEFHDLLVLARAMLRDSTHARSELHDRYRHLLLDEFQDTDPIQIELAMLIAASIGGPVPDHWSDMPVDDGRLFFVGDPKQSIYRFRRADIRLFLAARDRFSAAGGALQLVCNFRTVRPILEWVNALFAAEMADEVPDQQPRYQPLVADRDPAEGADHRPLLLGGPHPDRKVRADQLRECEADTVRATLCDIVARPEAWPVKSAEDPSGWRPARLSDVTILVPARTSLPFLRAALESAEIPYRLATGTLVYDTQEVRDTLAAVRAIDDPTDQLSLVAALRSPFYACSDVDLFRYHRAGGRWNLRGQVPESLTDDDPVVAAIAHLRSLWLDRWWLGPAALLERLLRERRAELVAFGDPRPTEVWQRLRFLVDQARQFEESGGGTGLRAFVDWAQLQGAEGARVHEPLLPETDDDAVRIMTIHGSKGLEFPITVLSGMTTRAANQRRGINVIWGESGPPEVGIRKLVSTANHEPRADLELEMDAHEKLRLLYVAATRARDHLVVSCHHKAGDKAAETYAGRIWSYFAEHRDLCRFAAADEHPPDDAADDHDGRTAESSTAESSTAGGRAEAASVAPSTDPAPLRDRDQWIERRRALIDPQRQPRVISATTIAHQVLSAPGHPDDTVPDDADRDNNALDDNALDDSALDDADPDDAGRSVTRRRRGRAGTAIGRAVHATLQVLDLADPREIEAQVARQCDLESIPEHAPTVERLVRAALGSGAVTDAAARTHHKELYLSAPFGGRVIEGYVDLLVETPDGLVVVDYKTDSVPNEAAVDQKMDVYELQAASYAAVLQAVTGTPVIDCRFVFCSPTGAIERSVADLPAAIERVRAALAAAPTG